MFLDFIGGAVLIAVMLIDLTTLIAALTETRRSRYMVTAIAGLWAGAAIAVASAGALATNYGSNVPLIGVLGLGPLVVIAGAALLSPTVRSRMLAIPMSTLIGLNVARLLGVFFLLLAAADRLGGPFPQFAGWGDTIVSLDAILLTVMVARGTATAGRIMAWNIFGALDLVVATTLAIFSLNGTPFQLIHAGAGSDAIQHLPWSLIPTVLVPIYLVTHGIIFGQLRARATVRRGEGERVAMRAAA